MERIRHNRTVGSCRSVDTSYKKSNRFEDRGEQPDNVFDDRHAFFSGFLKNAICRANRGPSTAVKYVVTAVSCSSGHITSGHLDRKIEKTQSNIEAAIPPPSTAFCVVLEFNIGSPVS